MKTSSVLTEGQIAVIGRGMRLASRMDDRIDELEAAMRDCRLSVDSDSMKNAKYYLDQLHQQLAAKAADHCEALAAQ